MMKLRMVLFPALLIVGSAAVAQDARGADVERAVVAYVDAHQSEANALLERIVNINSGTHNLEGVQAVARIMEDELKEIGFDFSLANSWLSCVIEMSQRKGLNLRSAAWKLAEDLKSWQEVGGFETAISNSKHQLSLLDMAIEDKKAAIGTLVDLRKMGMSEAEVLKLVKVVNGWGSNNNGNGFELDDELNLQETTPAPYNCNEPHK